MTAKLEPQVLAFIKFSNRVFRYQCKNKLSTRDLMYCLLAVAHNTSLKHLLDTHKDDTTPLAQAIGALLPDAWYEIAGSQAIEYEDPDELADLDFNDMTISRTIEQVDISSTDFEPTTE
jgi:hypothetical protein